MAAIPYSTAEAFTNGKRARSGAFRTDGFTIYSYGLLLAIRTGDSFTISHPLDGSENRSPTTARHIKALATVLHLVTGHPISEFNMRGKVITNIDQSWHASAFELVEDLRNGRRTVD